MTLTVGFDLDMTLIDSRPGIGRVWDLLAAETGVPVDSALVTSRLGPPVEHEMANWFPAERVQELSDRYRALYAEHGIAGVLPLPGAREALAAVRAHGGRAIVVTGKHGPNAQLNLDALGIVADEVHGSVFGPEKGRVLRAEGATVYVGDHLADITGARVAEAVAVAVATGPYDVAALAAAGADAVLPDLTGFPAWLAHHVAP